MSRRLLLIVLNGAFLACAAFAQPRYTEVRVPLRGREDLHRLAALGIAIDHGIDRAGRSIDLFVNQEQLRSLQAHAVPFMVLIDDWKSYYQSRRLTEMRSQGSALSTTTLRNFHLGSLGGFLTFREVVAEMDSMRSAYPSLISRKDSIGRSTEQRAIWCVKISRNADVEADVPRALYTGLHHAREPEGMMQLVYFMWYLLENYGMEPEVTALLDHRELYFVPVVNPDGYVYNESTDSTGGGLWRKNRRVNADRSIGVDLNRNYGFEWGFDEFGSSGLPDNDTYRGTTPFSETEIQAIRDLCVSKRFAVALNYHSFGNELVYPWGYSDTETRDSVRFRSLAGDLTAVNHYLTGTGGQTVGYSTNGDADDWMYGDTLSKPRMFSMTPEIGEEFWPPPARIIPVAQENLGANLTMAHVAGQYIVIRNALVEQRDGNDTVLITLGFANKGVVEPSSAIQMSVKSARLNILDVPSTPLAWQTNTPVVIKAVKSPLVQPGERVRVDVDLSYVGGLTLDSVVFRAGNPTTLYSDNAESGRARWNAASNMPEMKWDTTRVKAHSGTFSFTESPVGNYLDNLSSTLTLAQTFLLAGNAAEFRFWTTWEIEWDYDYARAEISIDGGAGWIPLKGRFSGTGSGLPDSKQPPGAPCYNGVERDWVEEIIDLKDYLGRVVRLRFAFDSDRFVNRDGMYVDDIRLLLYPLTRSSVAEGRQPGRFSLDQNRPNPFNPTTVIRYQLSVASHVRLTVYDLLGREVATLVDGVQSAGVHSALFSGTECASGIYFYRLSAIPAGGTAGESFNQVKKMVLLR